MKMENTAKREYEKQLEENAVRVVSIFCALLAEAGHINKGYVVPLVNPNIHDLSKFQINTVEISGFEIIYNKGSWVFVKVWNIEGGWENVLVFQVTENVVDGRDVYQIIPGKTEGKYVDAWTARYITDSPDIYDH